MLGAGLWRRVVATGVLITVASLAAAQWAMVNDRPWQSVLFVTLSFAQLGVALAARARHVAGAARNRLLLGAVALSAFLQVAAVQFGPLAALMRTDPLNLTDFAVCLSLAVVPGAVLGLIRLRTTRHPAPATAPH
jgi:Ca2+-transporting ATPase